MEAESAANDSAVEVAQVAVVENGKESVDLMEKVEKVDHVGIGIEADIASDAPPAPSKKSLKRLAKALKWEDTKKKRRATEKQKMKEKRKLAKESGTIQPLTRKALKKTYKPIDWTSDQCRVAIDLSFDDKMTTLEKVKVSKQLLRVYTLNRRSGRAIPVYFCGMQPESESMQIFQKNDGYSYWDVKILTETYLELFPKDRIVYLSSDSDNVLDKMDPNDVYVIGGLVDHNRHKGLCHELAEKHGLRHARLPIKENIVLKTRTVLTIEQVFDMLQRVMGNGQDWKSTLMAVLPQRKGAVAKPGEEESNNPEEDADEDDEEEATEDNESKNGDV